MKTKTLLFISLTLSSSIALAEMPGGGMAGDMVKDAATDAVKEKMTDSAKGMIKGTATPKASSDSAKDEKAVGTETPKSSTEGESTSISPQKALESTQ